MAVLDERDVGLVVADDAEHVLRPAARRQTLGLPKRRGGFLDAAALRQHDAGKRVEQREIPAIARGVEGGRRLGDVLANDGGVADLLVAEAQLVVGQADGLGIVRELGLTQRAAEQRDGARLVASGERNAAVEAPERGKEGGGKVVARIRRPSQRRRRLRHIVAQQPGFRQRAAQADFVFALEAGGFQRLREHADRVGMLAAFERRSCAGQRRLKGDGDHRREYTTVR